MDYARFFQGLPPTQAADPITPLVDWALTCLGPGEVYAEVGGEHLVAMLTLHPGLLAYGIAAEPGAPWQPYLEQSEWAEQVWLADQGVEAFCQDLHRLAVEDQIGVCLYDGPENYRSVLLGLLQLSHFLADQALILVTQGHHPGVTQALEDFLLAQPEASLDLDLTGIPEDWSGLRVVTWDRQRVSSCRVLQPQPEFLQSLAQEQKQALQAGVDQALQLALEAEQAGDPTEACQHYRQVLRLDQHHAQAWAGLGNLQFQARDDGAAVTATLKAVQLAPHQSNYHHQLGVILTQIGQVDLAMKAYERAIQVPGAHPDSYNNLANLLLDQGEFARAEAMYHQALRLRSDYWGYWFNLGNLLNLQYQFAEAIPHYQRAIESDPEQLMPYVALADSLKACGRAAEASAVLDQGMAQVRDNLLLERIRALELPVLYQDKLEITLVRQQFQAGLAQLTQRLTPLTSVDRAAALTAMTYANNFYLGYQGQDDLELQTRYGDLTHQVLASSYPAWTVPRPMPLQSGPLRVGYISAHFYSHTVSRLMLGWYRYHRPERVQVYTYHFGRSLDASTAAFKSHSYRFYHLPGELERTCAQILQDQLHILTFLDVGMNAGCDVIAGLRLAPIQCVTWGHPITTGLPTVDYFLSNELMEPAQGQTHYREKLVLLPHIGIAYPRPLLDPLVPDRQEFGFTRERVLYLSCQSLFKYLPQYDFVFPAIAQELPQVQFVFLAHLTADITSQFQERLERAFAAWGLDSRHYCQVLPRQNHQGYLNLNRVSDVYLDTFSWSGGNTTLEAVACGLPVVTCPGPLMRSRHSYGILRRLGVTETVARDEADYVRIAVALGRDPQWRHRVVDQMQSNLDLLYEDKTCVWALEEFYQQVVDTYQN